MKLKLVLSLLILIKRVENKW